MPKRLRIDYPGAFFHITSRGNRKQPIFLSDADRHSFLSCLREAHEKYGIFIHVYCLMENHYHLFLELSRSGLSKAMHLINMRYSHYFNLKHDRCGHTFQSRFHSILVEAAVYACEVSAYIHLNPVRARIVECPADYPWSNYRAFLGLSADQSWTSASFILRLFGSTPADAKANYEAYVLARRDRKLPRPFRLPGNMGILGSHEFIEQAKKLVATDADDVDNSSARGQQRLHSPSLDRIKVAAEAVLGSRSTITRKMAIYYAHTRTDRTLREIGGFFGIGSSGITDICRRLRSELIHNQTLVSALKEIGERLESD